MNRESKTVRLTFDHIAVIHAGFDGFPGPVEGENRDGYCAGVECYDCVYLV